MVVCCASESGALCSPGDLYYRLGSEFARSFHALELTFAVLLAHTHLVSPGCRH
jgi:hypothetical protein